MSVLTLPNDDAVVEFCRSNGHTNNGLAYILDGGDTLWIKHGPYVTPAEARTQDHACKRINRMDGGVARIPEVYRFFVREGVTYIIMEYIEGETATRRCMRSADSRSVCNKLSDALNQLLNITPPTTLPNLGPIGGGLVHHFFFADNVSAVEYDSVRTLEQQINSILLKGHYRNGVKPPRVDLESEKILFTFSDFNLDNFMLDKEDNVYIIDFQHAGYLPESFMTLAVHKTRNKNNPLAAGILAKHPHWTSMQNLEGLLHARYLLGLSNNNRLGLASIRC